MSRRATGSPGSRSACWASPATSGWRAGRRARGRAALRRAARRSRSARDADRRGRPARGTSSPSATSSGPHAAASASSSRATPSGLRRSTTSTRCEPLQALGGAPLGLWVRGPLRLDALPAPVAVVGARSATTYGADVAASSAPDWPAPAPASSPARRSASTRPRTGAPWPATGRRSPCSPAASTAPTRPRTSSCSTTSASTARWSPRWRRAVRRRGLRFLARNRLIAALSRGTVVVEAAVRSGALNTASWTARLNRPLMGVPGRSPARRPRACTS